jgi:hypothetical protein
MRRLLLSTALLLSQVLIAQQFLFASSASAQSGVDIDVSRIELRASPGASVSSTVNVRHPATIDTAAMKVKPYLRDLALPVSGTQTFPAAGSTPNSLARWIQVSPATFTLNPGKTQPVRYTVSVPAGTAPGLYWGALFFDAEADRAASKSGTTTINYQVDVGQIIYVQVGEGVFGGRLTGVAARMTGETLDVNATIANDGSTLIRAAGRAQVRDQRSGALIASVPIDESVALPGNRRTFAGQGKLTLPRGQYTVLIAMQYAPGKFFTGQTALEVK